jgi:phospholipase C
VTVTPSATTVYTATATDSSANTATSTATVTVVTSGTSLNSIKHIIFMIQENRSFDNYFGKLGAYRVNSNEVPGALASDVNDLDSLPSNFALKTKSTAPHPNYPIPPFHERTLQTENLSPSWNESHYDAHLVGNDYLNVTSSSVFKMDQFLQTTHSVSPDKYDPDGTRPLGYYDQTDLPYYYELATQFATSDAFHSSLLSQTNPNRMYLFSATSIGRCTDDLRQPGERGRELAVLLPGRRVPVAVRVMEQSEDSRGRVQHQQLVLGALSTERGPTAAGGDLYREGRCDG